MKFIYRYESFREETPPTMGALSFCGIFLLLFISRTSGTEISSVDRIVDGSPIDISEVPYMLSYMVNGDHACGAAILNEEWGLTAAHCVAPFVGEPGVEINIRSGSNRYDSGGFIHNVTYLTYHERYDDEDIDYDIAVFKVDPPFDFNNVTQPVKLPDNHVDTEWGLVAGWGYFLNFDPVLSETLQYVIVPKVDKEECREEYKDRFEVTDHQVCYGFREGGKDACKGDSGGPLVNNFTVIGITSWGDDCGEPSSPGVYTDVISLVEWVKNKTFREP